MKSQKPRRGRLVLKRGGGTLLMLIVMGAVALWIAGCGAIVTPPMNVEEPATVYVLDYGRHTTLLLPAGSGEEEHWVEYAYGEWKWFALDETDWTRVFPVMLWPTQGALGRLEWSVEPDDVRRERFVSEEGFIKVDVEAGDAQALLERLNKRYASRAGTYQYGVKSRLHFVHDDASYHLLHNCNHETARWLRELGCDVDGLAILADFRLRQAEHSATTGAPAP